MLSVLLITVDARYDPFQPIRNGLTLMVYPIQRLVNFPGVAFDWLDEQLTSRAQLSDKVDGLEKQNRSLRFQQLRLDHLTEENKRLKQLLNSTSEVGGNLLISELISVEMAPYRHRVLVNQGAVDGVFMGQPALGASGVVGQVVGLNPVSAEVMLITDPDHALPVQINRNGIRAIAQGIGRTDRLMLLHLPPHSDLIVGDLVVTSGLGALYPAGYPVAKISLIDKAPDKDFLLVEATPMVDLDSFRELLLLKQHTLQAF